MPLIQQQVTNTASFSIDGSSGTTGLQVLSHGSQGSTNDDDSQNGQDGQGAMLTTSGSIDLSLGSVTPGGMVVGVGVSSVGGNGVTPYDHGNGGHGGNAGNDNTGDLDNYGGNGGGTQNIELDNYANVSLGSSSAYLQGGTRAWGVAAQSVGGEGAYNAKGQVPMGQGGSGENVRLVSNRDVAVYFTQTGDTPDGVVGILAKSVGQRGGDTTWTQDNAGNGGSGGPVTLSAGDANLGYATNINVGVQPSGGQLGTSSGILGAVHGRRWWRSAIERCYRG